ncbi:FAD-dependent oxidoreductase [Nocardia amikacinitolerans]|uniref:hydroxysqualene dehydroxylase n=1 Tax=Nocardia amikacinitolerans TaxID=756689 RepID=UPI0020A30DB1|nr:FAD-dependent oxidoreductase [Nocardia amikacinitolerans]MCP2289754.1 NAD-binding domain and a Fe-S cluster-containing protein [Nocardia amikacinitolerans]
MRDKRPPSGLPLTRREVLRGAVAAGVGLAATASTATAAPGTKRTPAPGRSVAIFGGGVAGLSAAHELAERGYQVTVYEPAFLGGKARSMGVPGTGTGGRLDLPGEHGFRFFPGCYQNIPDTMRRIPFPGNRDGVAGNLIRVEGTVAGFRGRPPIFVPVELGAIDQLTPQRLQNTIVGAFGFVPELPPWELAFFAKQMTVWFTSCAERRYGQWEYVTWEQILHAEGKSPAYRDYLVNALTRITVAAKPHVSSARTIGTIGEALVLAATGAIPQYAAGIDRILNRPTNEAWIDPWVGYLRSLGVRFVMNRGAGALELRGGRIVSATVRGANGAAATVTADWYVCAMPVERTLPLLSDRILEADPRLAGMHQLHTDWMVGIQYYLTRPTELPEGHIAALGSPWALTALRQAPMWVGDFAERYGDGAVRECLSVDISDWDSPGVLYGRPAKECGREEIAAEVWAQLKEWLNTATGWLRDEDVHSWHLDPGITWRGGAIDNATPLLVNTVGSYDHRPDAHCAVPNLFFGGDHVRSNIDLATMEGANESGRAAANAIMDAADDPAPRAPIFPLVSLPIFDQAKRIDAERYRAGLPHVLDG